MKITKSMLWIAFAVLSLQTFARAEQENFNTQLELVSETLTVKPGVPIWIALRLRMDEGWHSYWKNPGDAGMATRISWRTFQGVSAGPIQWPVPKRFGKPPTVSYGYEGEAALLTRVAVPKDFKGDIFTIFADVKWMECADICLPGKKSIKLVLPVSNDSPKPDMRAANVFLNSRQRLPSSPQDYDFKVSVNPEKIKLAVLPQQKGAQEITELWFYPEASGVADASQPQRFNPTTGGWILLIPRSASSLALPAHLKGVLTIRKRAGSSVQDEALELDLPLQAAQ